MERMLRVHRVKFAGPGFSSMSPERRKKARRSGLRKRGARWRAKSGKTADWVGTPWECCWQAVRCREGWTWQEGEENRSKKEGQNSTGDNRNVQKVHGAEQIAAERDKEKQRKQLLLFIWSSRMFSLQLCNY